MCIIAALLACKKPKRNEADDLREYRTAFVRTCAASLQPPRVPTADYRPLCECIATKQMSGKTYAELSAEKPDAAGGPEVAAMVEECRFKPQGKEWLPKVPPPKPLEFWKRSVQPEAEDLTQLKEAELAQLQRAEELRDAERLEDAELIFASLRKAAPTNPEVAYQHYINLHRIPRFDQALDELEAAVDLGWNAYPSLLHLILPGAESYSPRYYKAVKRLRDRYNSTPPAVGTPVAFKPAWPPPKGGFPCLVVLHGYADKPGSYIGFGSSFASNGFVTITLPGSMPLGNEQYAWNASSVEPTHAQIQHALSSELVAKLIDPKQVVLFGFSQGAQHAFSLAVKHPESYAGVVSMSPGGLPDPLADNPEALRTSDRSRLVLIAGTGAPQDGELARKYQRLVAAAKWTHVFLEHPGGHDFPDEFPENGLEIVRFALGKAKTLRGSANLKPVSL